MARRSFLRYTGASAALGSLWLASCTKKDDPATTPTALSITSFSPASGMPGATITITGTGFTGASAVLLGPTPTTFAVVNATTITFTVPATAQTGSITITTPLGTVTTASTFTVVPAPASAPTIANFTPTNAALGATVTVTGTNFAGATALTVGGVAATPSVVNATTITFVVPATAVTGLIVVTTPSSTGTSTANLTVLPTTVSVGSGDAGVLNYAYALEQLEAAFYTQVRAGSYYTGLANSSAEKLILDDLYYHEIIHRDFLKAAIGGAGATLIKDLTPDFSSVDFFSRSSVLSTARTLEDLGVAAYNGAGRRITAPTILLIAGKIVSVEARHAALIRDLISNGTFVGSDVVTVGTTSLEISKDPATVVATANTFLAVGSKLDVSGIQ